MPFSRQEQLDSASESLKSHLDLRASMDEAIRCHSEQASQLTGLYEEVDKLAKGRSIIPTSDLFVELANGLIADVKTLVYRDTYLDRTSQFAPAGDNPSYPDILIKLRVVQQCLKRFEGMLKAESAKHASIVVELRTILAALQIAKLEEEGTSEEPDEDEYEDESEVDDEAQNKEEETEEESDTDSEGYETYVSRNAVKRRLGMEITFESLPGQEARKPYERWFERVEGEDYFNFAKLDRLGLPTYEPPVTGITFQRPGE
jgi:hypothetical protein